MKKNIPNFLSLPTKLLIPYFVLLTLLIGGVSSLSAENNTRGYMITKNGMMLTGIISQVFGENEIIFINDFGTPYKIHAALIFGFVVPDKGKNVFYASKFSGKKWHFMRLLYEGEGMNLYVAPVSQTLPQRMSQFGVSRTRNALINAYFVEIKGRLLVEIGRGNFKKSMRKLLKKETPELAEKIGTKGYRFKNLAAIIEEYDSIVQKSFISL